MYKHDTALIDRVDLAAAVGLLTRFPVIIDTERALARGAASAWAYPLVGVMLGAGLAAFASVLLFVGIPASIAAALVLSASVIVTGAMHEDGLADSVDGLWGGWDKARRMAIMKDSHIGAYGVCAIALSLLLRWLALALVLSFGMHWVVLMTVGALSRANMVALMAILPNARDGGLSRTVGRPAAATSWLALAIAALVALVCGYGVVTLVALLAGVACGLIAKAKIGGQTGDILGATQQVTEIAVLTAIVATLG